ncbi:MAG: SDR family oxidoreductase [Methylophilaceae bacterium]
MNLNGKRILLTGAAGGLGQVLAMSLIAQGAKLALVDRNAQILTTLCMRLAQTGSATVIVNNFQSESASEDVVAQAVSSLGSVDMLINCAGVLDFTKFSAQTPSHIMQMMHINSVVPMQLTRALLPKLLEKNTGHIVNIGSIFGSIGFPHYATYSASKFALRGFSQALRRELFDSNIKVTYIAPRAIKTKINNEASSQMMAATKTAIDHPEQVAQAIIKAIQQQKAEYYIGQPESFFAWINSVLPSLVSFGLRKSTLIAREFLK